MLDTSQCLTDGFSTGGTAGQGLGAVQRMSSEFDLFSSQPGGTIVLFADLRFGSTDAANENICLGSH